MKKLSPNWLTEGQIDFEYKKYLLLAYLKQVTRSFDKQKLYPFLGDVVFHYNNLLQLKQNKEQVKAGFPKRLNKVDLQNMQLSYQRLINDEEYIQEVEAIVNYALPKFLSSIQDGKALYEIIEQSLHLFPVGVVPIDSSEGYLLLRQGASKEAKVYAYTVTVFERADERYRAVKTHYVTSYRISITNTYENIKYDLIKHRKTMATPATYVLESAVKLPFQETLYPVARRMLMRMVGEDNKSDK